MSSKKVTASTSPPMTVKKYDPDSSIQRAAILFIVLLSIHLLFNLIKGFSKDYNIFDRDWGFNNISYFPNVVFILFYVICAIVCIPAVNSAIVSLITKTTDFLRLQKLRKIRWLIFLLISAMSIIVFYFLRIKYNLLGDMDLQIPKAVQKKYEFTEYATMYFLHYFNAWLHQYLNFTPLQSFKLHSYLSGVGYVFFLLLTADALGKGLFQKSVIFLFSLFFGTLLLFFGYVEIYSIPALAVLVYLYYAILCLQGKAPIILPAIALLLSLACYLMTVGLIPSFILLVILKYYQDTTWVKKIKAKQLIILILCALPLIYVVAPMAHLGFVLLPLKTELGRPTAMTLLSFAHCWEFFNGQLLASGAGFFLMLYLIYKAIRRKIMINPTIWLLSTAAFFMFYITFVGHLARGSGDWDIMSFPSIIYNILAIYWLLNAYDNKQLFLKYVVVVLITFNFLHTVTWIRINNTDKSLIKIKDMLIQDPANYYQFGLNALAGLGFCFKSNGLKEESLEYFKLAYQKFHSDPYNHVNYANELMERGNKTEATAILENATVAWPFYSLTYRSLINIYNKDKQYDKLYRTVNRLFQAYTQNPAEFEPLMFHERIRKDELKNYFKYLYQVETDNHNVAKANAIAPYIK